MAARKDDEKDIAYPAWFGYEVKMFTVRGIENINKRLLDLNIDAMDVINIVPNTGPFISDRRPYDVFYRQKITHRKKYDKYVIKGLYLEKKK